MSLRSLGIGAVIGAGVGYVAAVLNAPQSGEETQKDLENAMIQVKIKGLEYAEVMLDEAVNLIEEVDQSQATYPNNVRQQPITEEVDVYITEVVAKDYLNDTNYK